MHVKVTTNEEMNAHIDSCLNSQLIREMTKGDDKAVQQKKKAMRIEDFFT